MSQCIGFVNSSNLMINVEGLRGSFYGNEFENEEYCAFSVGFASPSSHRQSGIFICSRKHLRSTVEEASSFVLLIVIIWANAEIPETGEAP